MGKGSIAIVGGGVAGLTSAHALRHEGFEVTVFERAPALRTSGGALILWTNALKALGQLGLAEKLLAKASVQDVQRGEFYASNGELLSAVPIDEITEKHGAETVVMARAELISVLGEAAGEVRFNAEIRGLREVKDKVVILHADGREEPFDAVIGADGIHSIVRDFVGAPRPIRFVGQDMCVGTTNHQPAELTRGTVSASVGIAQRFWTAALGDGRTFWYAVFQSGLGVDTLDELGRLYADWHAPIPALIASTHADDTWWTPMRDRVPSPEWGRGRVTLAGDSAHAMTPDLGQGACQAIESALVLRDSIAASSDLAAAFRAYEKRRFERVSDVARLSYVVASSCGTTSPFANRARNAAVRFGMRAAFMNQLDWLYRGAS